MDGKFSQIEKLGRKLEHTSTCDLHVSTLREWASEVTSMHASFLKLRHELRAFSLTPKGEALLKLVLPDDATLLRKLRDWPTDISPARLHKVAIALRKNIYLLSKESSR